jgi:hypothetical protein
MIEWRMNLEVSDCGLFCRTAKLLPGNTEKKIHENLSQFSLCPGSLEASYSGRALLESWPGRQLSYFPGSAQSLQENTRILIFFKLV